MGAAPGFVAVTKNATFLIRGAASFRSSTFLATVSVARNETPVTLPPGRAMLATKP